MRKKLITVLLVVFLAMAVGIALVSCGNQDDPGTNPATNDNKTNQAGWKKIDPLDQKEMYQIILSGFTNVAQELSVKKISGKAVTLDGKAGLKLNGNDLWVGLKAKYDGSDATSIQHKTIASLELSSEENSGKLIGAYIFNPVSYDRNDDNYYLYLSLGENKVRFSMANSQFLSFFPFEIPDISSKIADIAGVLPQYIELNSIEGEKQNNSNKNKDEYKYTLDVNVSKTFIGLSKLFSDKTIFKDKDLETIRKVEAFVADLLNITTDQLKRGDVSDSSLKLFFKISGNTIQTTDLSIKMALGKGAQNLLGTDMLDLNVVVNDLTITNNYSTGTVINFVNDKKEIESYRSYSDAIYYLQLPVKLFDGNYSVKSDNHLLRVTTRVFQDNREENFFFCEYYDKTANKIDKGIYVYDDIAYVYMLEDGEEKCIYNFRVDLSTLATAIVTNTLNEDANSAASMDVFAIVAYIFKNIALSETAISFAINNEFFSNVWYNFEDMVDYLDRIADNEIKKNTEITEFIDSLKATNVIITIGYNDEKISQMLDMNEEPLKSTIEKLKAVPVEEAGDMDSNNSGEGWIPSDDFENE